MPIGEVVDPWEDDLAALRQFERADAARFAARATVEARLLASAAPQEQGWDGSAPWPGLVTEVAGTARVSQYVAQSRLEDARHLVQNLPGTHAALAAGLLFVPQARVLLAETRALPAPVCAEVERRVLPVASDCAPVDLRRRVKRAVLAADPVLAEQTHDAAAQQRAVWVKPIENGMCLQGAVLTAVQGRRFTTGLDVLLGRTTEQAGDARTVEQRRADLLADLPDLALELLDLRNGLLPPPGIPSLVDTYLPDTPRPAGRLARRRRRKAQVVVQVPVCTAVGLSDEPVWLDGHGWITATQGLALLPEAELRKACLDPRSGRLLALEDPIVPKTDGQQPPRDPAAAPHDPEAPPPDRRPEWQRPLPPDPDQLADALHAALLTMATQPTIVSDDDPSLRVEPQHDPSEALREFVDLRDGGCDGIGCTVAPTVCDQDHETPWPAGATRARGLRDRSRRCHGAKHHGWTVTVDTHGWSTWTSPGGRTYHRPPRHQPPPPPPAPGRRPRHVLRRPARSAPDGDDGDGTAATQPA